MGFRINTNIGAMNSHMSATNNNRNLDDSLSKLSSGLRINKAADDASGMSIADSLRAQSKGLGQAIANANDGIGVVQTADGALDEYIGIVNTIRTKAVQAASDGQSTETRKAIQEDIKRLLQEAQNIATTTSFNGQSLLNGAFDNKAFHVGAYSGETVNISIGDTQTAAVGEFAMTDTTTAIISGASAVSVTVAAQATTDSGTLKLGATFTVAADVNATSLDIAQKLVDGFNADSQSKDSGIRATVIEVGTNTGVYGVRLDSSYDITTASGLTGLAATDKSYDNALSKVDVTTRANAEKAIIIADYALKDLDKTRSDIGSVQNQLQSTIRNISVTQVNVQAAESQIRDVDFAAESANFAKFNILAQSGSYAMSQANAVQQNVLKLLQ
jgi:flagellin